MATTYTFPATVMADPNKSADTLKLLFSHVGAWGVTISTVGMVSGKLTVTVATSLSTAQQQHVGLL
jgi:hypothetical protein